MYHIVSHKCISSIWRPNTIFCLAPTRGSEISQDSKKELTTDIMIKQLKLKTWSEVNLNTRFSMFSDFVRV